MVASEYFNIHDYFLNDLRLASIGGRPAIEFRDRTFTYNDLSAEVKYWTAELEDRGITERQKVAMLLYDSPEFIAAFLAIAAIGAIAVPINTFLPADAVSYILRDCDARLIIAERDLESRRDSAGEAVPVIWIDLQDRPCMSAKEPPSRNVSSPSTIADSPAFILYTSGSTGTPKGVLHRHGAIPATVRNYSDTVLGLRDTDKTYSASKMFFAYGLGDGLSFPLAAGATTILHTERTAPEVAGAILQKNSPTVFFCVPALYRALIERHYGGHSISCGSLRACVSAGEALPGKILEEWKRETGLEILDGIGSTEMLHIFLSSRSGDARPDSSGQVVDGYEAKLLDDDGNVLDGEHTGNLWVKGDSSFVCYWNQPELTAEVKMDDWVRTGDVYRRTADGYFYHVGRSDDCFKVKGLWVSPVEVEAALLSYDAVLEAAVVADYDESGLATGHAFVVIRQGVEQTDIAVMLQAHASRLLPNHKIPSRIDVLKELPRTATGKVQRFRLRRDREATTG